ncbi:MAG: hypothetical protein B1H04_06430 [Planctomycetales bacterium 4484_123]|nr:MAG: hypothetical protein B1H04_06430 [Planctomycetales bacterium 4484_123]
MLQSLIDTIDAAHDLKRHRELLTALWQQEVWFDTPHQRAAAEIAREVLEKAGLSRVRLARYPCDGKSRFQDWTMPMAWDCPAARLTYADTGEVIADREKTPASVVFWSGPLGEPDAPATGEVVDVDALDDLSPQAVTGKFALTGQYALKTKQRLAAAGARPLAIISDYLGDGRGYTDETVKWCNGWSEGAGGWYFHADDAVMTGFDISPAAGRQLRQRLAENPHLKLAGFCDSRLYEGSSQCVTAVLEGTDPAREVWLYGHACEQGAHDNTSGVSILIETLRTLKELTVAGRLPRPRHSIRIITTQECVGMVAFATLNDDLRRRALVGMNIDGAGDPALPDFPFILHYGPMSNPTIAWAIAAIIAEAVKDRAGDAWHWRAARFINNADDMIAEPHCNVPGLWLGKGGDCMGYHSSADTPEVCSDDSLRYNTVLAAAWAYAMACLDDSSARQLLAPAKAWIDQTIVKAGQDDPALLSRWVAGRMLRDLRRWGISEGVYEPTAADYCPADAEPLPDLPTTGPRYVRTTWGTCNFSQAPPERRKGLSCWSGTINAGLYWNDGRRPLAAVERLAAAETGAKSGVKLREVFEVALEAGLMVQDNSENYQGG